MLAPLFVVLLATACPSMQAPQAPKTRTLEQLLERDDPAWPELQKWLASASNHVEVIAPPEIKRREAALVALNVTTRSMLGAITYETGGILIDHGWVRHLGAESERMGRSIARWNNESLGPSPDKPPRYVLVADDVIGGCFAQFPKEGGGVSMRYFAPDTLEWEDMGMGHSQFVHWLLSGDVAKFYENWRWEGWEKDVAALPGRCVFALFPPPSAEGPELKARRRAAVPQLELFDMNVERVPDTMFALSQVAAGAPVGLADLEATAVTLHGSVCRLVAYRKDKRLVVGLAIPQSLSGVVKLTIGTGTSDRTAQAAVDVEAAQGRPDAAAGLSLTRVDVEGDQRVLWFEVRDAERYRESGYLRTCLRFERGNGASARVPEAGMLAIAWRD